MSCENSVLSMANASFSGQCSRSNQSVFILAFSHFLSHHIFVTVLALYIFLQHMGEFFCFYSERTSL